MHTGKSAIWLGVFIVLLLVNVAVVVVSSLSTGATDKVPPGDASLLAASDEVQLDWWGSDVSPGEGPSPLKPSAVAAGPIAAKGIPPGADGGEIKDYSKLMAGYINTLKKYLNEYFHIPVSKAETSEE